MIIQHLSVSQMEKFANCELHWFYKTILKKKEPETAAKKTGTDVHTQLEHTQLHGDDVLGKIAAPARPFLPPRGPELMLEWGLNDKPRPPDDAEGNQVNFYPPQESLVRSAGVPLIGFIDLVDPRPYHCLPSGVWVHEPNVVEVIDYKTTSDFQWSKSEHELPKTIQMSGYGEFVANKFPWAEAVRLSHLNLVTKGEPAAKKVSVLVPIEQNRAQWHIASGLSARMQAVAQMQEGEVAGNVGPACEKFRGCPHKSYCHSYQNKPRSNPLKDRKMGLLKNRTPAAAVATNGAVATSASTTPWIPPAAPVQPRRVAIAEQSLTAKGATQGEMYKFSTGTVGQFISAVDVGGKLLYSFLQFHEGVKVGNTPFQVGPDELVVALNPPAPTPMSPPAPPVPPAPVAVFTPPLPPAMPAVPASVAPVAPVAAVAAPALPPMPALPQVQRDDNAPPPPPSLATQTAPAAKRGPGRPRKETAAAPAGAEAPTGGFSLFVNAVPNGPFVTLDGYVKEVCDDLCEAFKVNDIRSASNDTDLGFGRWKGHLASAVRAEPPTPGVYVAIGGGELMDVVVEALAATCAPGSLVRGVR